MKGSIIFREVGKNIHILNVSHGEIQSFSKEDGSYLLKNLKLPRFLRKNISPELFDFLFLKEKQINSRIIRGPLMELGSKFSFPTIVNIELNRRCLLRCKHCYIALKELSNLDSEYFDLYSTSDIEKLLNSLKDLGIFLIVFTGGEPFLNKNFQGFLKLAIEKDFVVEIFSNLQKLPRWFTSSSSFKSRIGRIQTSVYSCDFAIHDYVTTKNGSLNQTLKNLLLLKKLGYYLEVATPLMTFNYRDRHKTKKYFQDLNIRQSFSWPIVNEYYSKNRGKDLLNITKEQFMKFCEENPDFIIKPHFNKNKPLCGAGINMFAISANGSLFPCSQYPLPIGNLKKNKIENILKSNKLNSIKNLNKKIKNIKNKHLCYNFCIGNNYSETKNPLKTPDFLNSMFTYYHKHQNLN